MPHLTSTPERQPTQPTTLLMLEYIMNALFIDALSLVDFNSLTLFVNTGLLLIIAVLATAGIMVVAGEAKTNNQDFTLIKEDETEVIALNGAEEVSLQDYLDYNVNLLARTKHGKFAVRRASQVKAETIQIEIVDNVEYSDATYQPVEDSGVMVTDNWTFMVQYAQSVNWGVRRKVKAFTAMPQQIADLKAQNQALRYDINTLVNWSQHQQRELSHLHTELIKYRLQEQDDVISFGDQHEIG